MTLARRFAVLCFSLLLFWLTWSLYASRQGIWRDAASWGQAPPEARTAVLDRLRAFQAGYSQRDTKAVEAFVGELFSRDRPVVLGTMPGEVFVGVDRVREVVRSDWASWGDCRFRLAETAVAASGDVAWFATVGSVRFDLSRFLVLPLRLSGVMVKEADSVWRLRQAQFQFDLDLSPLLVLNVVLLGWAAVNLVWLGAAAARRLRAPR